MAITHQDKDLERVYNYLCWYLGYWIQPPPIEEIANDLQMSECRVAELLAHLEIRNQILPGSTIAKGCSGGTMPDT